MCDGVGWFSNHVPTGKSMVESLESESVVLVHKEVVFIVCVGALLVVKSGREDVLPVVFWLIEWLLSGGVLLDNLQEETVIKFFGGGFIESFCLVVRELESNVH